MRRAVVILVSLAVLACDRENSANPDQSQNTPARPSGSRQQVDQTPMSSTMQPILPVNKDMPTKRAGGAATGQLRVELNEYDIRMSDTLPAGKTSFFIVNSGKENHSFIIEAQNFHAALPQPLTRGDTAQLDVDLKAGIYTVYCPVDEHMKHGMMRKITVQ